MSIEERIDAIMEEAKDQPLSYLLPKTLAVLLECQDFEGYCQLSFWMRPKNKHDKDNMFGFDAVRIMMESGLSQEEAKDIYKKALIQYTNEIKIDEESCYGASVTEMEDNIHSYDKMNDEILAQEKADSSIAYINECEKTRANIINLRKNIVFYYSILRSDMMMHLVKCRQQQTRKIENIKTSNNKNISSNKVFIIHGHDHLALTAVENYVRQIKLNPIVLFKETSGGRTIIEKIEQHTDACYAIAIYTECDKGKAKEETEYHNRARQNVVFEHGFLTGVLGRDHVIALYKGDIEIPSDLDGVIFTPIDENGTWKYSVAKEMRAIGLSIDLDQIK